MFRYNYPQQWDELKSLDKLIESLDKNIIYYNFSVYNSQDNILQNLTFPLWIDKQNILNILNKYEYILINYNLYPKTLKLFEKELRWIIFRNDWKWNLEIISRPLHKFYNLNEWIQIIDDYWYINPDSHIDIDTFLFFSENSENIAELKEDGTMIQVTVHKDKQIDIPNAVNYNWYSIIFNTKNTLAKNIYLEDLLQQNFSNQILDFLIELTETIYNLYWEIPTINLEYINPNLEQHVVSYSQFYLFLLDIRLKDSWNYIPYKTKKEIVENLLQNYLSIKDIVVVPDYKDIENEQQLLALKDEKYIEWYVLKKIEFFDWIENVAFAKLKTDWYLSRAVPRWIKVGTIMANDLLFLLAIWEIDTFFQKFTSIENTKYLEQKWINIEEFKEYINTYYSHLENWIVQLSWFIWQSFYKNKDKLVDIFQKNFPYVKNIWNIISEILALDDFYLSFFIELISNNNLISIFATKNDVDPDTLVNYFSNIDNIQDILLTVLKSKILWTKIKSYLNETIKILRYIKSFSSADDFINNVISKIGWNYYFLTSSNEKKETIIKILYILYKIFNKIQESIFKKPTGLFIITEIMINDLKNELKNQFNISLTNQEIGKILFNIESYVVFEPTFSKSWRSFINIVDNLANKDPLKELSSNPKVREQIEELFIDFNNRNLWLPEIKLDKLFLYDPYNVSKVEDNEWIKLIINILSI